MLSLGRSFFLPSLQGQGRKVARQSKSGRSSGVFPVSAHRFDWSDDQLQAILQVLILNGV